MLRAELALGVDGFRLEIELEVPTGACLALAGPSGAGKTTLLRALAGLADVATGRIECGGEVWLDTARGIRVPPERRRCGYVFQDYALFPHLRAWQNVAYGIRDAPRRDRRGRAVELLTRVGLAQRSDSRPPDLSGGERQRVALARALAAEPPLLLLDEPLSALDARTRAHSSRELAAVLDGSASPAVLVTHDFAEAAMLGDRVAILDAGQIVQRGTPAELAASPVSSFVADLTGAVVFTGTARPEEDGLTVVELDGGGTIRSIDAHTGAVAASVYPWEITIEPRGSTRSDSARNRLGAQVASVTEIGNRVRVGLMAGQPLTAEITRGSAKRLSLRAGSRVTASWKATATRLIDL